MAILISVLESLFGCHHVQLSRVFTIDGETYRICCDCGAKYGYSLATMSITRRLPLTPVSTTFEPWDKSARRVLLRSLALKRNVSRVR